MQIFACIIKTQARIKPFYVTESAPIDTLKLTNLGRITRNKIITFRASLETCGELLRAFLGEHIQGDFLPDSQPLCE